MKTKTIARIFCIVLLLLPVTAYASSSQDSYYVTDDADLLTDEEEASLAARLRAISYAQQCDVIVYTTNEDIRDAYFDGFCVERYTTEGYAEAGVQFTVGMAHRTWDLYPASWCADALPADAQEVIYEDFIDYLSAGYYYDAFMLYADDVEYYLSVYTEEDTAAVPVPQGTQEATQTGGGNLSLQNTGTSSGSGRGISLTGFLMSLIGSLGISGASVSAMKSQNKTVRRASGARSYLVQGSLTSTLQQTDHFINNNIVRTPVAAAVSAARPGSGSSSGRPGAGSRPTHTHTPTHRPPTSTSGTFRRTGGGGSHGRF